MARIVSDWRIDFMRAHPRLFDLSLSQTYWLAVDRESGDADL
jgi:hypothetical protein